MLNVELIEEAFENRNLQEYDLQMNQYSSVNRYASCCRSRADRVAEPDLDGWKVNEFVKKAVYYYLFVKYE